MASKSLLSVLVVLSVVVVAIQAASMRKREAVTGARPETPLLHECDEPGENRENCFIQDPANVDVYKLYLEEIQAWEKANPKAAEDFNKKNPDTKKQEGAKLVDLEKIAKIHE